MRPRDEYTALTDLRVPGQAVFGYRTGDNVPATVVDDWALVVGEQVTPANKDVIVRPTSDADRVVWEAYAIGQGMDVPRARNLSREDLQAAYPDKDHDPGAAQRLRPSETALKPEWVEHVVSRGANREWAEDKHTTKADLQQWQPGASGPVQATDTVAASAAQQANGDGT